MSLRPTVRPTVSAAVDFYREEGGGKCVRVHIPRGANLALRICNGHAVLFVVAVIVVLSFL